MPQTIPQFGVQGGYWGTGQDLQSFIDKAMSRLLSPEEFNRLDDQTRSSFGGYMSYVNAFTRRQRAQREAPKAYLAAQAGAYEPQPMIPAYGGATTSTRGRIPVAGTTGGAAIPSTRISRDIYGRPTRELTGAGIVRGLGGEAIPQTAEQFAAQAGIELAIPREREQTAEEILGLKLAPGARKTKEIEADIKLADTEFKSDMTAAQRYRESVRGQAQQRIDNKKAEDSAKADRWLQTMIHREYMAEVNDQLIRARMKFASTLRNVASKDQQAWQKAMATIKGEIPGTPEAKQRIKDAVNQAALIADHNFENAINKAELDAAQKQTEAIEAYRVWLDKQIVDPGLYQDTQALINQRTQYGLPTNPKEYPDEASARAAGKKRGDIVIINGRKGRLL